jgi:hypothetical protein
MLFKWEIFMDNYTRSCTIRNEEFNRILENGLENIIDALSVLSVLMLPKCLFTYVPKEIDKNNVDSISMNEDKSVFVKYKDGTIEMIDHPLVIEDLKIFL